MWEFAFDAGGRGGRSSSTEIRGKQKKIDFSIVGILDLVEKT